MSKQALATKYRPHGWDSVVEQDSTKIILQQQLEAGEVQHAYLFVGSAGCGKTTCARIFANEINKGQGSPIELDAASHGGVDDVRDIVQQAKLKSLDSEYKVFIIDECVTGDTEILTSDGFKRFDECDGTEVVAQYNDGNIEYVQSTEWVKNEYHGDLIKWSPRNWCSVRMTPNHVQPLFYNKSQNIKEKYIKDIKFAQSNNLIVSGHGVGQKKKLTPMDRLAIVCQADATIQSVNNTYTHWSISLVKQRKIDRLLQIFADGNIEYNEIRTTSGKRRFTFNTPLNITKFFNSYFNLDFDYLGAREFIDEVTFWDGYKTDKYAEYMSIEKTNSDFVSEVAVMAGYSARQRVQKDNRSTKYKDIHKVFLYDRELSNCQHIGKTVQREWFDGYVYCVKVPSRQIVIRSQGFVFITGNCHSLSNTAWQAFLKLLEEPPAKSIFIFATTDPQKIPKTILSRVQRYDFKRISQQGIVNRLRYICDREVTGEDGLVRLDALERLAKISEGGLRDAITLLDKCLAYSNELTIANIIKVLGTVDYKVMEKLTDAIVGHERDRVLKIIEQIHMEGKDLKRFIRDYVNFLLDLCKYDITGTFEYVSIPQTEEEWLNELSDSWYESINDMLSPMVKLVDRIKYDSNPKSMIEVSLLVLMEEIV